MPTLMKDELFQAQLIRALGYAAAGGADLGECLAAADRIDRVDPDLWYDQWSALAARTEAAAVKSDLLGQVASARSGFLRASNYYRTAWVFLMAAPIDERLRTAHQREVESFRRGAALLDDPPQVVEIPYEDSSVPAYFFAASKDGQPRPTVVLTTGYDGSAEELYFANGAAALERGYNVLAFEGPGQGAMIIDRGVPFRPDWEAVITPVIDWLLTRPEVDPAAIALIGLSLGGYLAPRAASAEHRVAACVSDCGPYDVFDAAAGRLPGLLARQLPDGNPRLLWLLARILKVVMGKPTAGWALRRNLLVHGVNEPLEFFRLAPEYSLKGREASITCPTLVCMTDSDDLSSAAPVLYQALHCPKSLVEFKAADGTGDHCEGAARSAFHQAAFDWLATVLPTTVSSSPNMGAPNMTDNL
jgi:pimeloyl-ACP methyl ester carboxylesterase